MWDKIEKILKERNMTPNGLAVKMNIASATVYHLKYGQIKKPSFELACKIADALDIKLEELR